MNTSNISYNIGTSDLTDMYTRSSRAVGPMAEGVYIRQTTGAHGITTYYVTPSFYANGFTMFIVVATNFGFKL